MELHSQPISIKDRGALESALGETFFAGLYAPNKELVDAIGRLALRVVDSSVNCKRAVDILTRIFVESLDSSGFEKPARMLESSYQVS